MSTSATWAAQFIKGLTPLLELRLDYPCRPRSHLDWTSFHPCLLSIYMDWLVSIKLFGL